MRCKILSGFLLIFSLSTTGEASEDSRIIWGALDHNINLDIPDFQLTDVIDEIRWEKGKSMIANFKKETSTSSHNTTYEVLRNGTLRIKQLRRDDNDTYDVIVYDTNGTSMLHKSFELRILEKVSEPKISWECSNTTLTCEVMKGTDFELKLCQEKCLNRSHQRIISHKWKNLDAPFRCTASNRVSEKSITVDVSCSVKGLHFYFILGTCVGGLLLVVFAVLLIFYVYKKKKQNSRRKDEELEIKAPPRVSSRERGPPKPHPIPAAAPQNPAASQVPPPPSHRPQAPDHRPLPPSHRVQHHHKKRTSPSGTQVHQQKGPPLPRPRVQAKPPCEASEDALSPSPN
ncbi:T-cell surface antigen CD2 [Nannospalax galili]|uniref:T-cell surface antigen CD2 n=1 Tax=Nannospalax galili TaxID=1026970 RepID=A0A8C6R4Z4_NANGA|nr:T-cell surface antigen CD2 [Nannospalax galili]XP_029419875.1 T-cell surface antigen CD2 [Nannospalax galili]